MAQQHTFNIGKEFSRFPGGRYSQHGDYAGEDLRNSFLAPLLKEHEILNVELDDTQGYGSSFLEEAFGGLVRHKLFTKDELHQKLNIVTCDEAYRIEIFEYIDNASP